MRIKTFAVSTTLLILVAVATTACDRAADQAAVTKASDTTGSAGMPAPASAEALLGQVAAAYRGAPTITDRLVMQVADNRVEVPIEIDSNDDLRMQMSTYRLTAVDGALYAQVTPQNGKFFKVSTRPTVSTGFARMFNQAVQPPVIHGLRTATETKALVHAFHMGYFQDVRLTGMSTTQRAGRDMPTLEFAVKGGHLHVYVDPDTRLLHSATFAAEPGSPGMQGRVVEGELTFNPVVADALETPIRFNEAAFREVANLPALLQLSVGDPAPDFELPVLDQDRRVRLSDLRGKVVVLDFWATWCGPCRRGLPHLQEFADWVDSSGAPVEVWPVDVLERFRTPAETERAVRQYWQSQSFSMATMIDHERALAGPYGLRSIPQTYVIAPDGTVAAKHMGYDPNMVQSLKNDVAAAMQ